MQDDCSILATCCQPGCAVEDEKVYGAEFTLAHVFVYTRMLGRRGRLAEMLAEIPKARPCPRCGDPIATIEIADCPRFFCDVIVRWTGDQFLANLLSEHECFPEIPRRDPWGRETRAFLRGQR